MKYKYEITTHGDKLREGFMEARNPKKILRSSLLETGFTGSTIRVHIVNEEGRVWIYMFKPDHLQKKYRKVGKIEDFIHKEVAQAIMKKEMDYTDIL